MCLQSKSPRRNSICFYNKTRQHLISWVGWESRRERVRLLRNVWRRKRESTNLPRMMMKTCVYVCLCFRNLALLLLLALCLLSISPWKFNFFSQIFYFFYVSTASLAWKLITVLYLQKKTFLSLTPTFIHTV